MSIKQNLQNKKHGKLTVIKRIVNKGWLCQCECGQTTYAKDSHALTSGKRKSCGCINKPHGRHGEKIYRIWKNMRSRCHSPSSSGYYKYGGRGIKVCDRWSDFNLFVKDMGEMPGDNYSIERIDPKGNYEPENCKWLPVEEQRWNKTNSRLIKWKNQTKNLNQWIKELGLPMSTVKSRLRMGYPLDWVFSENRLRGKQAQKIV